VTTWVSIKVDWRENMVEEYRFVEDADLKTLLFKNMDCIYVDNVLEKLLEHLVSKYIIE